MATEFFDPNYWTRVIPGATSYLTPLNGADSLVVGAAAGYTALNAAAAGAPAYFIDPTGLGLNYFITAGIGLGFISLGGTVISTGARGTPGAEAQLGTGSYIGGHVFLPFGTTAYSPNTGGTYGALPGYYAMTASDPSNTAFDMNLMMGGVSGHTPFIARLRNSSQNSVTINDTSVDMDFSVNWDTGVAQFMDGATGLTTFDPAIVVGATNPASAGNIRLPNATNISWRNAANTANQSLNVNASNRLQYTASLEWTDATNVVLGTTTGSRIGTNASQKLGFYTATPIVQPANTVAINDVQVNLGLRATGGLSSFSTTVTPPAGTATAGTAPVKFTSGTNLTTAEAGAMEYNGNHYVTKASGLRVPLGGGIFDFFTDVTVGGAETDIYTSTTAASTLAVNGAKVTAVWAGNFVTVGTELTQLKVYFAGSAIWDSTGVAPTTGTTSWRVRAEIIRVSSTVVRYAVTLTTTTGTTYVYETVGELTGLTLTNTNILKITGTSTGVGSGSGDIVGKMGYVDYRAPA